MSPETPRPQPIPEEQLQPEPAGGVEGEGEAKSIEEIKQAEELPPELVSLVADLKTVFYSSSEQIKLSLSALNLKLTKKLDSIPDLEIKPSALEAITHELEIIYSQSRSTGQLTEEQYLAVKAMNYQLERAVDKLNSEKDALFERLNQLERDLDDEKAKESKLKYPSNFEVSRTRAQNYRTKSKLGQLVYRSFASRQHAKDLALEKETLQIETRLTELSEELVKVQKKIADLDDDIRQINSFRSDHRSLINISEKYINKRILRPATDQIESSIEEAAEKIKPYLVEEYLTKAVIPRLEQYQIRQVDQLLAEGDWLALKQEQRSKNNLAKLLSFQENENGNSNSQIFLSEQGRELFGLTEQDNRLTVVDLDRAAGTFKLKSTSSDKVSDPFSFEQIDELMLTRYNFEPGNKINQYKVVEWNLADRRLAVRKNQQEEVYQGVDKISQFLFDQFFVQTDASTGERYVNLIQGDPLAWNDFVISHRDYQSLTWQVQEAEQGAWLTREIGFIPPDLNEEIIQKIKQMILTDQAEVKREISWKISASIPNNRSYLLNDLLVRCQHFEPKKALRSLLLDQLRQDGAWSQDALLWTPNEIPPENFFGLKQAQNDTVYGERYHQDLDFLISSPLVQKLFPQEVETIFERRLSESRALVAEDPVKWQKALATLYANGDVQDFNQLLLYSLDQPQLPLYSLYQDNPHFFKEKAVASSDQFPSLLNLVDYFDLSQTDPYFHPNCQELINLLAKDLKAAVIDQKFGPIEKQKIFQILTQKDNRQFELENLLEPDDQINPALAKELLVYLRTLPGIEDNMSPTESVEETGLQFAAGINRLNQEIRTGQLATFETALKSLDIVSYLARHPEQIELIFRLPEEVPEFMELVSEGGSLEDNRDQLINYLFADGQLLDRAREMVKIFAGNTPLADRTMAFIEARLKLELQSVVSGYPVGNEEEITGFDQLSYENKMRELFHRISQAINISRSTQAKERASQRNQTLAQARSNFQFQSGMYLHGMSATTLPLFFRNGNLAGEALGPSAQADSYPFHVDYSYLDDELSSRDLNLDQTIAQLPTESFGRGRENDHDLQVILVTDRRISQWEKDITYFAGNTGQSKHTLILGATPTTETHYVLLRDPQGSLPMFIQASVQAEHYIPAYAISQTDQFQAGELIFSYEDFRQKLAQAKPYQNFQEFIEKNQNLESDLLKPYQEVSQHGAHRFNLAEHLQLASEKAQLIAQKNKLNDHETLLVQLAALLHDVGKQASGVQEVDNPVIAQGYLNKIQKLSPDEEELILNLIRYDELLGDIVQGKKSPSQFERLFPNQRHRLMLLTLYQADVQSIDNDLSENGLYQIWQVETKLRELGIIS